MSKPNLPLVVLNIHAEGPPKRKLELACHVTNPTSHDICILDAWVEVEVLQGLKIADGKIFQSMHRRIDPAAIPAGENGLGALHIELPDQVLQHIEERRAGGDVTIRISSRVLVAEVSVTDAGRALGEPYETSFGDEHTNWIEYTIPQSEWIKILKGLRWSELEILELPSGRLRSIPTLTRALDRFQDAQRCYRRGDWAECMLNCRKAFEATVKDTIGEDDMGKALKAFQELIGEGERADHINSIVKDLTGLLHLARHETYPAMLIKRADAQLALHISGALLVYLGSAGNRAA